MSSSMASNAILAKARAMYGRCLKQDDYRQLMECHNVAEVALYLKNRTAYGEALKSLNENSVHRGQLEVMLRQDLYYDVFALSRYARDKALVFSEFIVSEMEIEQIMRCLTLLNIHHPEEYIYSMPLALDQFTKIDLRRLAEIRSYEDLIEVLAGTKYQGVLKRLQPAEGERIDIAHVETALNNLNYAFVISAIDSAGNDKGSGELKNMVTELLDFRNLSRIFRLKKYYGSDAERITPLLIPYGRLSRKQLDELCHGETAEEVLELARKTYLGRQMAKLRYKGGSQMAWSLMSVYCRHHLRLSPNPTIVMISYVYLKQIEINNIINIIEATRYGLPAEEKTGLLVG